MTVRPPTIRVEDADRPLVHAVDLWAATVPARGEDLTAVMTLLAVALLAASPASTAGSTQEVTIVSADGTPLAATLYVPGERRRQAAGRRSSTCTASRASARAWSCWRARWA